MHGDICPWNLLIDPETDTIQLFDFNSSAKLGWEGDDDPDHNHEFAYDKDRNDVKFVIFTIFEIITRELKFRATWEPHELDESMEMKMPVWDKHADVPLDCPVEEFRRVLETWVKERAEKDKTVDHFSKASEPLEWPALRTEPDLVSLGQYLRVLGTHRARFVGAGKEYIRWERPATKAMPLPAGQRLLATGEIVGGDGDGDDGDAATGRSGRR